jgi:predicted metalloprotease with PDZ domain
MRHRRPVPTLAATAALILLLLPGAGAALELSYNVACADLAAGVLQVELVVAGWPGGDLRLRGVPAYVDNPTAAARGEVVRSLTARDARGGELRVRARTADDGEPLFAIPQAPADLSVAYELAVDFVPSRQTEDYPVRVPFMSPERAWLYGNYVFCYPELAGGKRESMSVPVDVAVRFRLPPEVPLVGPPAELRLPHLYALMSLQFGLGSFLIHEGEAAGVPFRVVLHDSLEFSAAERSLLRERTRRTVAGVTEFFGGAPYPSVAFYYFRHDGIGGLEGAYALQAHVRHEADLTDPGEAARDVLALTALHEYVHTWVPIALFAREDPWWKEGITCYYGLVLSARLGWLPADEWEDWLAEYDGLRAENPLFGRVALTDPRIWDHEYDGEDWRTLTYDRGQAVALLLDVHLRERTGNARSLDDVLRRLFRERAHRPFGHEELLAAIRAECGVDAAPFFARHVEGTTPPTLAEVRAALARAVELGAFPASTAQ